jgi:hypothetical protein
MSGKTTLLAIGILAMLVAPAAADLIVYAPSPVVSGLPVVADVTGAPGDTVTMPLYVTTDSGGLPDSINGVLGIDVAFQFDTSVLQLIAPVVATSHNAGWNVADVWDLGYPGHNVRDITGSGLDPLTPAPTPTTAVAVYNVTFKILASAPLANTSIHLINFNADPTMHLSDGKIVIPEPSSLALLAGLLLCPLAWHFRRRRGA